MFWGDLKNQRKFLEWAGKQLKINDMDDWYKITSKVALPLYIYGNKLGY
jgi:hypothetical protein